MEKISTQVPEQPGIPAVSAEDIKYMKAALKQAEKAIAIGEVPIGAVIVYEGKILWDTTKPNGTPRKLLDVSKAAGLGWTYRTELEDGIRLTYQDFLNNPMRAER